MTDNRAHFLSCHASRSTHIANDDPFIESIRLENFDFYSPWGFEKIYREGKKILVNCSTSRCR